jgi:hypothetical protein
MWETVYALRKLSEIEFADPPTFVVNDIAPNDLYYQAGSQWYLAKIQAENAWDVTTGSSSRIIAIIDNGVDRLHPDLSSKISGGESGYSGGTKNHGTQVAGVAGAATNNSIGMASLGWNIMISPYNYDNTSKSYADIYDAVSQGAHIINCSWRRVVPDPSNDDYYINYNDPLISSAILYAISLGRIVVASAGNYPGPIKFDDGKTRYPSEYPPYTPYPAANTGVIAVSATNSSDNFPSNYNYGNFVDVSAPGISIFTTDAGGTYSRHDGTSFSAPLVAALAGLVWSKNPNLTPDEVANTIYAASDDLGSTGWDDHFGYGRINANKAVRNLYVPQVFSTIQAAANVAVDGQTILIQNGTYNENVTINSKDYLTITAQYPAYPHINGNLSISYSDNLYLYNFSCNKIYLSNCQDPDIYADIYGSGSGIGLHIYCSSYYETAPYYIWNFNTGLYNFIASGNVYANAQIFENGTAVYSYWGSVYLYGSKLCGSINYDLYATYRGYILAQDCYYDNGIPRWYGNVDIGGIYNCSYLGKVIAGNGANNQTLLTDQNTIESDDPAIAEFREVNDLYFDLSKRVKQDIAANRIFDKAKFYNDYMNLIDNFRNYIDKYPNFPLSGTALTNIVFCFKKLQEYETMKAFLQEIREDGKLANLRSLAKRFMIDYYRDQNDFTNALRIADEILLELKSDESPAVVKTLITNTLFEKGMIYAHNLNQPAQAAEYFASIIKDYPDDNMVDFARHELWLLGYDVEKEMRKTAVVDNLNFSINNYPNPFNPVTTINYSIPVDEKVVLKVYDVLGREVAELVNEVKQAGRYSVEFNASSLSSGMYFYSITAGDYHQKKKMILMK